MIHVFIINNYAGNRGLAENLREHLETKRGLRYFVFNTVKAGYEKEIAHKLERFFEGEKLRFYSCGGSGTMRNLLNGLKDLSNVEVAFFPCGLTNDFLKTFPEEELFQNIDYLIEGTAVAVDYIKSNYGVALNTLSFGLDSSVCEWTDKYRIYEFFGNLVPYVMSLLRGVLISKPKGIKLSIDGVTTEKNYSEVVLGNGAVLGGNLFFTENTSIVDGEASYFTLYDVHGIKMLRLILKVMNKQIKKLPSASKGKACIGSCKTIDIESPDGSPLHINFDGELVECGSKLHAEIVQTGLNFVIPRGVKVKEYRLK